MGALVHEHRDGDGLQPAHGEHHQADRPQPPEIHPAGQQQGAERRSGRARGLRRQAASRVGHGISSSERQIPPRNAQPRQMPSRQTGSRRGGPDRVLHCCIRRRCLVRVGRRAVSCQGSSSATTGKEELSAMHWTRRLLIAGCLAEPAAERHGGAGDIAGAARLGAACPGWALGHGLPQHHRSRYADRLVARAFRGRAGRRAASRFVRHGW